MHIRRAEQFCPNLRVSAVLTTDGEVTEALQRNFLGVTRTGNDAQLVHGDVKALMQVVRDDDVLVGYHTFDGRNDHFMRHVTTNLRQCLFHVRRGDSEDEHIRLRHRLVDVGREMNAAHFKLRGA